MTPNPTTVLSMISTPHKFFEHPSQVTNFPGLRRSDRIDILRSWKLDVTQMMKAAGENMAGDNSYNLEDINNALQVEIPDDE